MKVSPRKIVLFICAVLCVLFIWTNSVFSADISGSLSGCAEKVLKILFGEDFILSEGALRKLAHCFEFALFGTVLSLFGFERLEKKLAVICFFGLFTAVCDETIQLFSDGRFSSVKDIWIDFAGFAAGTAAVLLIKIVIGYADDRKGKH